MKDCQMFVSFRCLWPKKNSPFSGVGVFSEQSETAELLTDILTRAMDLYKDQLCVFGHIKLPRFHQPKSFNDRMDPFLLMMCRVCPNLHTLVVRERVSTSTVLLLANEGKKLRYLYIRRNAVILRCDWPHNPEWSPGWARHAAAGPNGTMMSSDCKSGLLLSFPPNSSISIKYTLASDMMWRTIAVRSAADRKLIRAHVPKQYDPQWVKGNQIKVCKSTLGTEAEALVMALCFHSQTCTNVWSCHLVAKNGGKMVVAQGVALDFCLNLAPLDIVIRAMARRSAHCLQQMGLRISTLIQEDALHIISDQSPSSRVASDLLSLNRSMSSRVIGLITGHGHLRKHLHRVCILPEDPLYETAEHLLFDCPSIARERYAIFGSLDRAGEFPQEDLIGCFRRFASWCVSGVHKKSLRLKCMAVGRPKEKKNSRKCGHPRSICNEENLQTVVQAFVASPGKSTPHHEDDSDRRMKFCETKIIRSETGPNFLRSIFWCHEACFKINGQVNRHNCVCGSDVNPHNIIQAELNVPGVMV
ncbi:hypothetical protein J6590_088540 [Homalodisca vitripennis]|nr:hypothetical protein J6590_088540 [Homalodisca vitripennis]